MIVIGFIVQIRLLSSEVSADEHRTMYIANFIVVDQVTQYDDDLNALGHRYGEPPNPNSMFDNDTDFYGAPKCAFDKV